MTVQDVIGHLQQLVEAKPELADQLFILRRPGWYGETQDDELSPEDFDPEGNYSFADYTLPNAPYKTVPCLYLS